MQFSPPPISCIFHLPKLKLFPLNTNSPCPLPTAATPWPLASTNVLSDPEFDYSSFSVCVCAKSVQWCLTHCNPVGCNPPGSSAHGILQARTLGGLRCPPAGALPDPEMEPSSLNTSITWEALYSQSRRLHLRSTTSKEDLSLSECILSAFCQRARQSGKWLEVYTWLQRSQLPVYRIKFSFLHFYGISPSSPFDFSLFH